MLAARITAHAQTRDETALKHNAGVEEETPEPKVAYAGFTRPAPDTAFREEFLTG